MDNTFLVYLMFWGFIWGVLTKALASSKGLKHGFIIGFAFGLLGFIVVLCMKSVEDKPAYDKYNALEQLSKLRESGAITDEEYKEEKNKILNS